MRGFALEDGSLSAAQVKVTKAAPSWNPGRTARQALQQLTLAVQGIGNLVIWAVFFVPLPTALLLFSPLLVAFGAWQSYRRGRRATRALSPTDRPTV